VQGNPFPDPAKDPLGYFVAAFSMPKWLAERWLSRASQSELMRLGFWFNTPAKLCLRVNTLQTTRERLLEAFHEAKIEARPGIDPEAIWLDETAFVQRLPRFEAGWFAVQDESAMAAARLLDPRPGQTVLDLCAAPGGKTTHLAGLMNNEGRIVAADVDGERLRRVEESCRRLGVRIVETHVVQRDGIDLADESFDRILVDVPCSNTGVLGKRPEVRWRLQPADIIELAGIQTRLLRAACARLRPSGRLVYSTCSIEPEENRAIVNAVLRERNDIVLLKELHHTAGQPADGGYQALLQKTG
jgi:16S rRNA (cytosine967-C5)-methyltransferase